MSFNCYYNQMTIDVIHEAINNCNEILTTIRNKTNKWDVILLIYLVVGLIFVGGIGFVFAYYVSYVPAIVLATLYIIGIILLLYLSKKNAHEILLSSHL